MLRAPVDVLYPEYQESKVQGNSILSFFDPSEHLSSSANGRKGSAHSGVGIGHRGSFYWVTLPNISGTLPNISGRLSYEDNSFTSSEVCFYTTIPITSLEITLPVCGSGNFNAPYTIS